MYNYSLLKISLDFFHFQEKMNRSKDLIEHYGKYHSTLRAIENTKIDVLENKNRVMHSVSLLEQERTFIVEQDVHGILSLLRDNLKSSQMKVAYETLQRAEQLAVKVNFDGVIFNNTNQVPRGNAIHELCLNYVQNQTIYAEYSKAVLNWVGDIGFSKLTFKIPCDNGQIGDVSYEGIVNSLSGLLSNESFPYFLELSEFSQLHSTLTLLAFEPDLVVGLGVFTFFSLYDTLHSSTPLFSQLMMDSCRNFFNENIQPPKKILLKPYLQVLPQLNQSRLLTYARFAVSIRGNVIFTFPGLSTLKTSFTGILLDTSHIGRQGGSIENNQLLTFFNLLEKYNKK